MFAYTHKVADGSDGSWNNDYGIFFFRFFNTSSGEINTFDTIIDSGWGPYIEPYVVPVVEPYYIGTMSGYAFNLMQKNGGTCTTWNTYAPSTNSAVPINSCVGDGSSTKGVMFQTGSTVDIWTFTSLNEGNNLNNSDFELKGPVLMILYDSPSPDSTTEPTRRNDGT